MSGPTALEAGAKAVLILGYGTGCGCTCCSQLCSVDIVCLSLFFLGDSFCSLEQRVMCSDT